MASDTISEANENRETAAPSSNDSSDVNNTIDTLKPEVINTVGVFQTYYESGALFTESSSNITWIGSIQCFLLQLTGIVAGPIYDRSYLRLILARSFMVVFGYMMLSLRHEYWQAMLVQAFCVGIGSGLLFTPTVSLLPTWLSSHIGLAVGIASSGGSFGGVIYPIVLYRLIRQIGFPWADEP